MKTDIIKREQQQLFRDRVSLVHDIIDYFDPWTYVPDVFFPVLEQLVQDPGQIIDDIKHDDMYRDDEYWTVKGDILIDRINDVTQRYFNICMKERYFNMTNKVKGFKAVCSMTKENRYFHFWTRAYFDRRNNQVFSIQFVSENNYMVFPDDDIFEWLHTDRAMTQKELKEYFQEWYDTDFTFKTAPIF